MKLAIFIFLTCKLLLLGDDYIVQVSGFKSKAEVAKICKNLKCVFVKKEDCSHIKLHTQKRSCEIKEALEYLKNSGYYHFSAI